MSFRLLLFILMSASANAQVNPGARVTAMGNSGTALQGVYSLGSNQAGIAHLQKPVAALVYVEHFMGSDIRSEAGMAAIPGNFGVIGVYIGNYGLQNTYSELKAGISYARMFGPHLAMALTMNYHQLKIPRYGSNTTFSAEVGVQYSFSKKWIIGAHVANPGNFSFNNDAYTKIPVRAQLGTAYQFSEQVLLCIGGTYTIGENFDGNIGLEYALISWFKLRGGISVNDFQQYAGFGFLHQRLSVDVATTIHPRLGVSPQLSLCYVF